MFLKSVEDAKNKKYMDEAIFKKQTEPLLERLSQYLIKKRNLPTEWPGIKTFPAKHRVIDICTYTVCEEAKKVLLESPSLFCWRYPYFPDDLCFFKNGYCWFSTVAHEGYACAYVRTSEDVKTFEEIGIKFTVNECDISYEQLFFEDYSL